MSISTSNKPCEFKIHSEADLKQQLLRPIRQSMRDMWRLGWGADPRNGPSPRFRWVPYTGGSSLGPRVYQHRRTPSRWSLVKYGGGGETVDRGEWSPRYACVPVSQEGGECPESSVCLERIPEKVTGLDKLSLEERLWNPPDVRSDSSDMVPLILGDNLGSGAFNTVFKMKHPSKDQVLEGVVARVTNFDMYHNYNQADINEIIEGELNGYQFQSKVGGYGSQYIGGVYEYGETTYLGEQHLYGVIESLDGGELSQKTGFRRWECALIMIRLLLALRCVSRHGFQHLDVKPANLALKRTGDPTSVKLVDFGLARTFGSSESCKIIRESIGTPLTMSREMFEQKEVCPKTDIWSAGVTLLMLLKNDTHPVYKLLYNELDDTITQVLDSLISKQELFNDFVKKLGTHIRQNDMEKPILYILLKCFLPVRDRPGHSRIIDLAREWLKTELINVEYFVLHKDITQEDIEPILDAFHDASPKCSDISKGRLWRWLEVGEPGVPHTLFHHGVYGVKRKSLGRHWTPASSNAADHYIILKGPEPRGVFDTYYCFEYNSDKRDELRRKLEQGFEIKYVPFQGACSGFMSIYSYEDTLKKLGAYIEELRGSTPSA